MNQCKYIERLDMRGIIPSKTLFEVLSRHPKLKEVIITDKVVKENSNTTSVELDVSKWGDFPFKISTKR